MSHHLDTPLAAQNGQLYIDDFYVFGGASGAPGGGAGGGSGAGAGGGAGGTSGGASGGAVFVMNVNSTVTGPDVQPGFHTEARYEFKVHFDGAAMEELTYRVAFAERDGSGRQAYVLWVLAGEDARDDAAAGELLLEGRTGEPAAGGGVRMWAGLVSDPFYADLPIVSLVNKALKSGTAVDLSQWHAEEAKNIFAGTTVEAIVLEISPEHPRLRPGALIGVWCATKLATDAGGWRQINRGGFPMMWPLFRPDDTRFTDPANTRHPSEDFAVEGVRFAGQVAAVVAANRVSDDPRGYGETVARTLLPDILPYVVGAPAVFNFAAFNGRPLADNAPEVMMSLVAGMAVPSGLKPAVSQHLRSPDFPYVVPVAGS